VYVCSRLYCPGVLDMATPSARHVAPIPLPNTMLILDGKVQLAVCAPSLSCTVKSFAEVPGTWAVMNDTTSCGSVSAAIVVG
jgi:hypothetical protein